MENLLIDIIVPTYKRAECIRFYLERMDYYRSFSDQFRLLIIDSSPDSCTEEYCNNKCRDYLMYYKLNPNIDVDKKTVIALKLAIAPYVMLCGDGIIPNIFEVVKKLHSINKDTDMVCVYSLLTKNDDAYYSDWKDEFYTIEKKNEFIVKHFLQFTLYGGAICKKTLIDSIETEKTIQIYTGKNFVYPSVLTIYSKGPFESIIGNYFEKNPFRTEQGWISSKSAVHIWTENLSYCVDTLSSYIGADNSENIKKFVGEKFFNVKTLIWLRCTGNYNLKILNRYKSYLRKMSPCGVSTLYFIACMPKLVLKLLRVIYKKLKRITSK